MNYYQRHLGDYARDTNHLSLLEHGVYTLLLDRYYVTEQPIPADQAYRLARATSSAERKAVDAVLAEFFTLEAGHWYNSRAQTEIEKAKSKIEAARSNGRTGGRPKASQTGTQQKPSGLSVGSGAETQHEPSEKLSNTPITITPIVLPSEERRARDSLTPEFAAFLQTAYPECNGRRHWHVAIHNAGVLLETGRASEAELRASVLAYREHRADMNGEGAFSPQNFFALHGDDLPWQRVWKPPKSRAERQQDANVAASVEWLERSSAAAG